MSGTDRFDQQKVGLQETAAVRALPQKFVAPDGGEWNIEHERAVLKKFDGDWTAEQMDSGEADSDLAEVIVLEDGVVIDHWHKGEGRDAPS